MLFFFFFSSRRRHTRFDCDWSSDVCSSDLAGELYGTLRSEVERVLRGGKHVVLDVEVTGARQVRKAYPRPASVVLFVIPPSPRVLIERLRKRRTESEAELSQRIDKIGRASCRERV